MCSLHILRQNIFYGEYVRKVSVVQFIHSLLLTLTQENCDKHIRAVGKSILSKFLSRMLAFLIMLFLLHPVESYRSALEIDPLYLDALSSSGSAKIILGDYVGAASDLSFVMHHDSSRRFQDVFTGLARILQAKESAVPEGWGPMIAILRDLIPLLEVELSSATGETKTVLLQSLNRLYHVLFVYHDVKTKQTDLAWESLTKSYEYKMSSIEPFNYDFERQKVETTKQIFHKGFFPEGVGSSSSAPIFIIGFVRSGSTLLERLLDSHPQIVGTGENSVFNGQLDYIRNKIVETSIMDSSNLSTVIEKLADGVVTEMLQRWRMVSNVDQNYTPKKMVDKMLTNYYNVGFIHMLFPNALILHVARYVHQDALNIFYHSSCLLCLVLEIQWIPSFRRISMNSPLVRWIILLRLRVLQNSITATGT